MFCIVQRRKKAYYAVAIATDSQLWILQATRYRFLQRIKMEMTRIFRKSQQDCLGAFVII